MIEKVKLTSKSQTSLFVTWKVTFLTFWNQNRIYNHNSYGFDIGPNERSQDFLMNEGIIVQTKKDYSGERTTEDLELPLFDFTTLAMATNNFSDANKLGQGGFGCVYKVKKFYCTNI